MAKSFEEIENLIHKYGDDCLNYYPNPDRDERRIKIKNSLSELESAIKELCDENEKLRQNA